MKKLISSLLCTLAIPLSSHAGVYIGAVAGYGSIDWTPEVTFAFPNAFNADINLDLANDAFIAAPVIGYEWKWPRFRLGTEFQAFWTELADESSDTNAGNTTMVTFEHEYVWLLRPGYQLFSQTPLVLYLSGGATWAKVNASSGTQGIQAISFNDNVWGYKAGAGLAYNITPHVVIRGDYLFSQYQSLTNTAPQDFGDGTFIPITAILNTTQSQYLLGLTYQW